jgi:hypothetical protein
MDEVQRHEQFLAILVGEAVDGIDDPLAVVKPVDMAGEPLW